MKVLVYGAGVLGSYLAQTLSQVGHEVTLLARGKRYHTLKNLGLVIEHAVQKKTTVMRIDVLEALLLFAFLGSGGRMESCKVISIHKKEAAMVIGDLHGSDAYKDTIVNLFKGSPIVPWHCNHINAWLKYHLSVILPLAYGIHWAKGDIKKLAKSNRVLKLVIQGFKEGVAVLKDLCFSVEPSKFSKMVKVPTWLWLLLLKTIVRTKAFKLAAVDHAMAAVGEMAHLSKEFKEISKTSHIKTPALDELETYLLPPKL